MDTGWEQALRLKMEQRSLNFCALAAERRRQELDDADVRGGKKPARVSGPSRRAWLFLCGRRGARDCSPSCGRPRPGARRLDWDRGHHRFGRDPMSHRIIEKRRRDRMNNCLADLSRLIPAVYLKKGRGRVEKTEIIEMAIKHLRHLQAHSCKDPTTCEVAQRVDSDHRLQYRLGFQECLSETARFLVDLDGSCTADDTCFRLVAHLQKHFDKVSGAGSCYPAGLVLSDEEATMEPPERQPKQEPTAALPDGSCSSSSSCSSVSQLREMLQNPGLSVQECMRRSSDYLLAANNGNNNNNLNNKPPTAEEAYKFKNDIKDRFHKDAQWGGERPDERRHSHSQGSSLVPVPSPTRHTVSAPPPDPPPENPSPGPGPGVAAFALHPRGSFYIPVTLDPTLVGPALAYVDESPQAALHPVSISVQFGRQRPLGPPPWPQCPWRLRLGEPNGCA
ncbi:protein hairy isoform X1 [Ixodes scapularis]|uniref:protein hairy isoform X1 n=1 Tax=Ixodes scapularis TaxID=6945 RepID=UPI001A9F4E20|nr:protein hairy isoform X1 [Ixodes scapularis]